MLRELSLTMGRQVTLDDIADQELDHLKAKGFDWVWYLGVWQTGSAGLKVSRENPAWLAEYRQALPDLQQSDITGSCFAITSYTVHTDFGGDEALKRLRMRMHERGICLMLDFVPNHTALDHPWVETRPEFYLQGDEEKLRREPQNYTRVETARGPLILAYGRDPYFAGWPDTLQLNYAEPMLQQAMLSELMSVASRCDGVRCDMAMLVLPEVFQRTWGLVSEPFWPKAVPALQDRYPGFMLMAEVYWALEWTLQQQGFDYTYDKRLYDRLRDEHAPPVRDHFRADISFQQKSARFLENHDEPRAAVAFPLEVYRPAAVLTFLCPGLRFFHQGQLEGRKKRLSVHLGRRAQEPINPFLLDFHDRLLGCVNQPITRTGQWCLLNCSPAWDGNWTWECFICFGWRADDEAPLLVAVNYAPNQSQCYVQVPFEQIRGQAVRLEDLLNPTFYERSGDQLLVKGFYMDLPPWGYHVFKLMTVW